MEQVGLVTYVDFKNVSIKKTQSRKRNGRKATYHHLNGNYIDHNNIKQNVHIELYLANLTINENEIKQNNYTSPGAYYTLYPSWSFLRESSPISVYLFYSILSVFIFIVFYNQYVLNSVMKHFVVGRMVKPNSFGTKSVKTKRGLRYQHFILWDTPKGTLCESNWTYREKQKLKTLEFDHEYCGMYLEDNSGRCLIIAPQDEPKVIKKYGYKINDKHIVKFSNKENR